MTKKEWKICGTGKRQSPIDLSPGIARLVHNSTKLIQTYYKPVEATLKNRGYDIMVYNYSTFKKSSIFIFLLPISLHDRYVVWIRFHGMTTQGRLWSIILTINWFKAIGTHLQNISTMEKGNEEKNENIDIILRHTFDVIITSWNMNLLLGWPWNFTWYIKVQMDT